MAKKTTKVDRKVLLDQFDQAACQRINDALYGDFGAGQQAIAETGVVWIETLLKKNKDYGSAIWKEPIMLAGLSAGDAILVRISDKVERCRHLLSDPDISPECDESLRDSMADLGGYCLLYLAVSGDAIAAPQTATDEG